MPINFWSFFLPQFELKDFFLCLNYKIKENVFLYIFSKEQVQTERDILYFTIQPIKESEYLKKNCTVLFRNRRKNVRAEQYYFTNKFYAKDNKGF